MGARFSPIEKCPKCKTPYFCGKVLSSRSKQLVGLMKWTSFTLRNIFYRLAIISMKYEFEFSLGTNCGTSYGPHFESGVANSEINPKVITTRFSIFGFACKTND